MTNHHTDPEIRAAYVADVILNSINWLFWLTVGLAVGAKLASMF